MSDTLALVGTIAVSVIGVSGSGFGAWWAYQAKRRNRSPVIAATGVWTRIVGYQRCALSTIDDCLHEADPIPRALPEDVRKGLLVLREGRDAVAAYWGASQRGTGYRHYAWPRTYWFWTVVPFFWFGPRWVWYRCSDWQRRRSVRRRLLRAERSLTDISYLTPELLRDRLSVANESKAGAMDGGSESSATAESA